MNNRAKNAGFILSLELLLILTVLAIGLVVGVVAVRDAIFQYMASQQNNEVFVSDSNGENLGVAVGFDEHEAPLLMFVDGTGTVARRALMGIRDDRFTSREPVYYTLPNCQGDPCIKSPSSEDLDNSGTELIPGTGAVSFFNALQGGPNYAIGAGADGDRLKGGLYRETPEACDVTLLNAALGSRWNSQKVVSGEPCEPHVLPLPIEQPGYFCPGPADLSTGLVCSSGCDSSNNQCACPADYESIVLDENVTYCCPAGSSFEDGPLGPLCKEAQLMRAESVPSLADVTINALTPYTPPFSINAVTVTPANGGSAFRQLAPDTEAGTELP